MIIYKTRSVVPNPCKKQATALKNFVSPLLLCGNFVGTLWEFCGNFVGAVCMRYDCRRGTPYVHLVHKVHLRSSTPITPVRVCGCLHAHPQYRPQFDRGCFCLIKGNCLLQPFGNFVGAVCKHSACRRVTQYVHFSPSSPFPVVNARSIRQSFRLFALLKNLFIYDDASCRIYHAEYASFPSVGSRGEKLRLHSATDLPDNKLRSFER